MTDSRQDEAEAAPPEAAPPEAAPPEAAPPEAAPPEAAPPEEPKRRRKVASPGFTVKTVETVSTYTARNWGEFRRYKIEVYRQTDEPACAAVSASVTCGATRDKGKYTLVDVFKLVTERDQWTASERLRYVRQILDEGGEDQACVLDDEGKTPDVHVNREKEPELYNLLTQAVSRTILHQAECGQWSEIYQILPSLQAAREAVGGLGELLKGEAGLSPHGWTALHLAARNNQPNVVKALHDAKCDLEQKDLMLGYTALHHAIANSACDSVDRLITIRADVSNREDLDNLTPLDLAMQCAEELHSSSEPGEDHEKRINNLNKIIVLLQQSNQSVPVG